MATQAAYIQTWQSSNTPLTCRMLSSRLARSSGNVPSHVPAPGVATGLKTLALLRSEWLSANGCRLVAVGSCALSTKKTAKKQKATDEGREPRRQTGRFLTFFCFMMGGI